jgi:hypothetical protein
MATLSYSSLPNTKWYILRRLLKLSAPLFVLVFIYLVAWVCAWNNLGCHTREIDVLSGELRDRWLVCSVTVYTRTTPTNFSTIANRARKSESHDWRIIETVSVVGGTESHYRFSPAPGHLENAAFVLKCGTMSATQRLTKLDLYLQLLQLGDLDMLSRQIQSDCDSFVP